MTRLVWMHWILTDKTVLGTNPEWTPIERLEEVSKTRDTDTTVVLCILH